MKFLVKIDDPNKLKWKGFESKLYERNIWNVYKFSSVRHLDILYTYMS